jgi:hypothetical protein
MESRRSRRGIALALAVGTILGAAAALGVALVVSDRDETPSGGAESVGTGETSSNSGAAALTPFDRELLRCVPDELRSTCRHAAPLSSDFDATLACRPGGAVFSVTYSHARSGFVLYNFFVSGMTRAGLPAVSTTGPAPIVGLCSTGDIPSLNNYVAVGLRGRTEVQETVGRDERVGLVRCYERGDRSRIEWTTSELGVYAAARGEAMDALYDWWRTEAGPEP